MVSISIAALVYRSRKMADWVHDSIYEFTPYLRRNEAEFYFVANDPTDELLTHLEQKGYRHYVNRNDVLTQEELFEMGYGKPEYLHRVYRGWNKAILQAKGEIVVLVNSDNYFSPDWLENMLKCFSRDSIITSKLVEREHPEYGVIGGAHRGEFGRRPDDFDRQGFLDFCDKKRITGMERGGAYMPCMFSKDAAVKVGLYPEGNIAGESFDDVVNYGDRVFFESLNRIGVEHFTALDSLVYHLKEGEMADTPDSADQQICADSTSAKDPDEEVLVEADEVTDTKIKCSMEDDKRFDDSISIKQWWDHCQANNHWFLTGHKGPEVWERLNITDKIYPGQVVLNIGVGLGYCTEELTQRGCVVHALDICEAALDRVRNTVVKTWLPEQLADLPANTFDLAISNLVTQHMNDKDLVEQLCAVRRSLKPNGVFAMQFGYSLNGDYELYKPTLAKIKSGGVLRTLSAVNALVEKTHGRIAWIDKISTIPEHNAGWYGIHIVKSDESIPVLQNSSLENISDMARFLNEEGEDLFNAGNMDDVEAAFLRCLELNPKLADAHNNLGVVYSQRSNPQLALKHFNKAVSLEPENQLFVANYDKALEFVGRTSEPSDLDSLVYHLKEGEMADTPDSAGQQMCADATSAKDPNEEVLAEADEVTDTKIDCSTKDDNIMDDSMSTRAWWDHCQAENHWYLSGSKGSDVWERLNITDRIYPGQVVLNIGVGLGYCTEELAQRGCVVHALDICEAALDRVRNMVAKTWLPEQLADLPANTFDLAISNLVTQHMNDEDLLEQLCAVARSLKPNGVFAMQFAYSLNGQYDSYRAIPTTMKTGGVYRSLIKMNLLVSKGRGRILWADKIGNCPEWNNGWYGIHIVRNDEANPFLQNCSMESRRDVAKLFNADGEDLFDAGDVDGAEAAFLRCLELDPELADAHNNLGVVYSQRSNPQLALKHFSKAVSLEPENQLFVANYDKGLEFAGRASEPSDLDSEFLKGHAGDDKTGDVLSLRTEYLPFGKPDFSGEEIEAVSRTMRAGWVGMGQETIKFEEDLASYLDVPHVVTVNSCTSALFLSLLTHGIGPGDEVICPSLTWCSTANAALYLGAKPVFCDVDPDTLCITPESISEKLTVRTRAVIVVHFGGLAADVERIRSILPPGAVIIEDAAHALGTKFPNAKPVATSGNLTCFSFYANKNLSTAEGGAIALFDDEKAEHLRSLRQHALASNAWNRFIQPKSMIYSSLTELGYKMNYTDLQAAIGRVQLKRQPEFNARRLEIANLYYQGLSSLKPQIRFQHNVTHPYHARHLFAVVLPVDRMTVTRDEFLFELRSMNIGASIHYAPLHTMPLYASAYHYELIHTERIGESILTLPISASMSLDDARYVTGKFIELFNASTEHEDQFCGTFDLHEESRVRDKVRLL